MSPSISNSKGGFANYDKTSTRSRCSLTGCCFHYHCHCPTTIAASSSSSSSSFPLLLSLCCCFFYAADSSTTPLPTTRVLTSTPGTTPSPTTSSDPRFVIVPVVIAFSLSLALLFAMCIFKWPRLGCLSRSNRVLVDDVEEGTECGKVETNSANGTRKGGDCGGDDVVVEKSKGESGLARRYSWEEVQQLTMGLSQVIGSGGFSTVYLARMEGSDMGAVKVHCGGERLSLAFRQELDILLRVRHERVVKLLGYCDDRDEGALVFEYIPNGNLQEKIHGNVPDLQIQPLLPWGNRVLIAFQLAQAIEYLHEKCTPQIVHGDIKSSNILLDHDLNCKLCDFGCAKMGFSSLVMRPLLSPSSASPRIKRIMMGSPGYTDPHYLRTGILTKKNDIYSYGVIILELVTGIEAFCVERGQMLTTIASSTFVEKVELDLARVAEMVDPRLNGEFDLGEVKAMLSLARSCLQTSHALRPSASQILEVISDRIPSVAVRETAEKTCQQREEEKLMGLG